MTTRKRERSRRGHGTVYTRKDGRVEGQFSRTVGGKRKRHTVYGETREEVVQKLKVLAGQDATGTLPEPSRFTVEQFLTRWLEDTCRPSVRESTYALYSMLLRKHVLPKIGGTVLQSMTPATIQKLLSDLERDGVAPPTRAKLFRVLGVAFGQALAWNLILRHPMKGGSVKPPRVPQREMQTLTPELARQFLEAAKGDRLYALYAVLLGTGLRIGEALGLTWPDLDLEKGTLTVRRQLSEVGGDKKAGRRTRVFLQEPKTATAQRTVNLPGFVIDALRGHQERMRKEKVEMNDRLLVFVTGGGDPIRKSNLRRRSFLPLLKAAGIPRIRLHDLRHSYATISRTQGTDILVISRNLGHSKPSITWNIYSHVFSSMGREAADTMDKALRPQRKEE